MLSRRQCRIRTEPCCPAKFLLRAGDVADVVRVGERDNETPVVGSPARVRILWLRL